MYFKQEKALDIFLNDLFKHYRQHVPEVQIITNALIEHGIINSQLDITNDHIAFRTLGIPHLGIQSFEKIFLHHGYIKRDYFYFEGKKLNAYWYAHPSPEYPRIFLSELIVEQLSEKAQAIINKYTHPISEDPVNKLDLDNGEIVGAFFHQPLWALPSLEDYVTLLKESEYAAWVIYNRYYLNHYTISVHDLPEPYNNLENFNKFIESLGVRLNTKGGKIKESADKLLRQSSTVAGLKEALFIGNERMEIAGSYVEFAERLVLPQFSNIDPKKVLPEYRRDGFETSNADKIFESTYSSQTNQNVEDK